MKLENQIVIVEQAKRLKWLGVSQNAIIHYQFNGVDDNGEHYTPIYIGSQPCDEQEKYIAAFTTSEIGRAFGYGTRASRWLMTLTADMGTVTNLFNAQYLAAKLITAIENGLTTVDEVNERLKNA